MLPASCKTLRSLKIILYLDFLLVCFWGAHVWWCLGLFQWCLGTVWCGRLNQTMYSSSWSHLRLSGPWFSTCKTDWTCVWKLWNELMHGKCLEWTRCLLDTQEWSFLMSSDIESLWVSWRLEWEQPGLCGFNLWTIPLTIIGLRNARAACVCAMLVSSLCSLHILWSCPIPCLPVQMALGVCL